jgi:hypothetical protein
MKSRKALLHLVFELVFANVGNTEHLFLGLLQALIVDSGLLIIMV